MPAVAIVEFFRAVPLLLLMIFLFVFIQQQADLERETNALFALVAGLTLYNGAVLAEVFRAGINAMPRGQSEAAYAIGMRKTQVMMMILTPQAVKYMLPAIISQCVVVLKDTSLGGVAASYGPELVRAAKHDRPVRRQLADDVPAGRAIFIVMNSLLSAHSPTGWSGAWRPGAAATQQAVAEVEGVLDAG